MLPISAWAIFGLLAGSRWPTAGEFAWTVYLVFMAVLFFGVIMHTWAFFERMSYRDESMLALRSWRGFTAEVISYWMVLLLFLGIDFALIAFGQPAR